MIKWSYIKTRKKLSANVSAVEGIRDTFRLYIG